MSLLFNHQRAIKTNSDLDHLNRRVRRPKTARHWQSRFPRINFDFRDFFRGNPRM